MSATHYCNCETCGQPYTVEEHAGNVTFTVGGHVVKVCPVCEEELKAPQHYEKDVEDGG